jgi:hypothetical protein
MHLLLWKSPESEFSDVDDSVIQSALGKSIIIVDNGGEIQ